MDALAPLVVEARNGDADAYAVLVRRFQDMAVGYGYSILQDFHLAEDAAQEAFFEAYRSLSRLREPAAFPGWFRRIVFKQCDRITRRHAVPTVPLEDVPAAANEWNDMKDKVLEAVDFLPEHERAAVLLYYINGHSQNEVASFLEVPVSTVKGRLHSARTRLREMLLESVEEGLRSRRPSRSEWFANSVVELLKAARAGDVDRVKSLLAEEPRLLTARDPLGNTALIMAVNSDHQQLAEMLMEAGVQPDIYESAAIGDSARVACFLEKQPALLDSYSPEGFPALALAAHFGHIDTLRLLLEQGADINKASRHPMQVTPLHAALFGRKIEVALLLIQQGADVKRARGGKGWPRAGWTALHYAAGYGFEELMGPLLQRGAEIDWKDDEGKTPLQVALEFKHVRIAEMLREKGAK